MIQIGSPGRGMDRDFLLTPGGFAWWYLDLLTPEGDGLVLIWSYGLPFLPGYAESARRADAPLPVQRPSLNVAAYRAGKQSFYLLQEYLGNREQGIGNRELSGAPQSGAAPQPPIEPPAKPVSVARDTGERGESVRGITGCGASGGRSSFAAGSFMGPAEAGAELGVDLELGDSRFRSWVECGRHQVEVNLDCLMPGSRERLRGTVQIEGVARQDRQGESEAGAAHLWTPLTGPAMGSASLDLGTEPVARLEGRAYHDRNGGRVPLHELGIERWMWGRFPLCDCELIVYLLWPTDATASPRLIAMTIDACGQTHTTSHLRVKLERERRSLGGIRWPQRLRLLSGGEPWLELRQRTVVDNGPFYLRFQSEATTAAGERVLGWVELCYPQRVDLAVHRPLVRMRVHHTARRNSIWLPLFSGPRAGRVGRLLRNLLPGGA